MHKILKLKFPLVAQQFCPFLMELFSGGILRKNALKLCLCLFLSACSLKQVGTELLTNNASILSRQFLSSEPNCCCLFPSVFRQYMEVKKYLTYCDVSVFFFFKGELMEAIKRDFGSFANFKEKLTAVSVGVQGSGWGWLGYNKEQGRLQIAACANQDPLQGTTGQVFYFPLHFL